MATKKKVKPKPVTQKKPKAANPAAKSAAKKKPAEVHVMEKKAPVAPPVAPPPPPPVTPEPPAAAAPPAKPLSARDQKSLAKKAAIEAAANKPLPVEKPAKSATVTNINKRITIDADQIKEWRIARSLRPSHPGFFLQGGFYDLKDGKKFFRVGAEEHFTDLNKAKHALVAKLPAAE